MITTSLTISPFCFPPHRTPLITYVVEAIAALKSRTGVSRQAIQKQVLVAHADLAGAQFARFLRAALKKGVEKGVLLQTKQSFKLNGDGGAAAAKKATAPKKAAAKKAAAPKKAAGPKKAAAEKKAPAAKKVSS